MRFVGWTIGFLAAAAAYVGVMVLGFRPNFWLTFAFVGLWTAIGKAINSALCDQANLRPRPVLSEAEAAASATCTLLPGGGGLSQSQRFPVDPALSSTPCGANYWQPTESRLGRFHQENFSLTNNEMKSAQQKPTEYVNVLEATRSEWRPLQGTTNTPFRIVLGPGQAVVFTPGGEGDSPLASFSGEEIALIQCGEIQWIDKTTCRMPGISGKMSLSPLAAVLLHAWEAGSSKEFVQSAASLTSFSDPQDALLAWSVSRGDSIQSLLRWKLPSDNPRRELAQLFAEDARRDSFLTAVHREQLGKPFCHAIADWDDPQVRQAARQLADILAADARSLAIFCGLSGLLLAGGGGIWMSLSGCGFLTWLLVVGGALLLIACPFAWNGGRVAIEDDPSLDNNNRTGHGQPAAGTSVQ